VTMEAFDGQGGRNLKICLIANDNSDGLLVDPHVASSSQTVF
jgi:hypothetical protein